MARPKSADDQRRDSQISIRVSAQELASIMHEADKAGLPASTFVRMVALRKRITTAQTEAVDFETRQELRRIGNNINQVAKGLNARDRFVPHEILGSLEKLNSLFDQWLSYGSSGRQVRP